MPEAANRVTALRIHSSPRPRRASSPTSAAPSWNSSAKLSPNTSARPASPSRQASQCQPLSRVPPGSHCIITPEINGASPNTTEIRPDGRSRAAM